MNKITNPRHLLYGQMLLKRWTLQDSHVEPDRKLRNPRVHNVKYVKLTDDERDIVLDREINHEQAAEQLKVSSKTIRRWRKELDGRDASDTEACE